MFSLKPHIFQVFISGWHQGASKFSPGGVLLSAGGKLVTPLWQFVICNTIGQPSVTLQQTSMFVIQTLEVIGVTLKNFTSRFIHILDF